MSNVTSPTRRDSKASRFDSLHHVPTQATDAELLMDGKIVHLTNLGKLFWSEPAITKRELLQYYADMAEMILPHIRNRAMVMKRYPNGAAGEFFFQKRAPAQRPDFIPVCNIEHASASIVDFPVINDCASLLWLINLGCIDLNQWYAECDDVNRPDYLHFDLDPVPDAGFECVLETALLLKEALDRRKIASYPKTTGSRGLHIYVPIVRGPLQKEVWTFAKALARELAAQHPGLITAEYRIAKRPRGRVLVDYNQNAWCERSHRFTRCVPNRARLCRPQ